MYLESKTTYLIKLKTLLQSNYLYIFLLIVSLLYFVYCTYFVTYKSKYNNETFFQGNIVNYKIDGNKLSITFKEKELLIANYYFKTEDEKKTYENNVTTYNGSVVFTDDAAGNKLYIRATDNVGNVTKFKTKKTEKSTTTGIEYIVFNNTFLIIF